MYFEAYTTGGCWVKKIDYVKGGYINLFLPVARSLQAANKMKAKDHERIMKVKINIEANVVKEEE